MLALNAVIIQQDLCADLRLLKCQCPSSFNTVREAKNANFFANRNTIKRTQRWNLT